MNPVISSVADAIPFDPSTPNFTAGDDGYNLGFDFASGLFLPRGKNCHHAWAPMLTTTPTTASGTLTLTNTSDFLQLLTGTATGFSVQLPSGLTITPGWRFEISNQSSQNVVIKNGAGTALFTLAQNSIAYITFTSNGTIAGNWLYWQVYVGVASGIVNYTITSTTAFNTAATTDTLITGFSITPVAGTYSVWYNASVLYTTTPISHYWSIYKGGARVVDSERRQDTAHSNQVMVDSTMTTTQFNGSQACDVRVRCGTSGNITVNARTLTLVRLGN